MSKKILTPIFILFSFISFAQFPDGYYNSAEGLLGVTVVSFFG